MLSANVISIAYMSTSKSLTKIVQGQMPVSQCQKPPSKMILTFTIFDHLWCFKNHIYVIFSSYNNSLICNLHFIEKNGKCEWFHQKQVTGQCQSWNSTWDLLTAKSACYHMALTPFKYSWIPLDLIPRTRLSILFPEIYLIKIGKNHADITSLFL